MNREQVLRKYPRITAHLICESLGYFTPLCAAGAIQAHLEGTPCYCEWYSHMTGCRGKRLVDRGEKVDWGKLALQVGLDTLRNAIAGRRRHNGYMAEYKQALALVKAELERSGCTSNMLASWF